MLETLVIRNIALIEAVDIEFADGLNVLTGETGAGKSIMIDSMNLALGARSDRDLIKSGCTEARVEMVFGIAGNAAVHEALAEMDLDNNDDTLIIARTLSVNGRNSCRINGSAATVAQLRTLTALLIDIHGQHEHQSLLNETHHMQMLDAFGGAALLAQRDAFAAKYAQYRKKLGGMRSLFGTEQERARRADILRYQIKEIKAANLSVGEEEDLTAQLKLLQHAEEINNTLRQAYEAVYSGGEQRSAMDLLGEASRMLTHIAQYGEDFRALGERMEQAIIELEDIAGELREKTSEDFDETALNEAEARMDAIRQLKRKYGGSIADILQTLDAMETELAALDNADEQMAQIAAEIVALEGELTKLGAKLTKLRRDAAALLEARVVEQLADLGMKHAKFSVEFDPREGAVEQTAAAAGFDRLRFLISPNPGEPLKPLARIASGGEMSRIMLALKNIAAQADSIPTLIFDEIDTGISGNMARAVAQKLANIATGHQVICVTHTAQIAAMGGMHFFIEKQTDGQSTRTSITQLQEAQRVEEIGRLVGGDISTLSVQHAGEMLEWSRKYRQSLS